MNRGVLYGMIAYVTWGVLPVFWKLLKEVPPLETVAHRIIWSLPLLIMLLVATRQLRSLRLAFSSRSTAALVVMTALLLMANWTVYIWGVNSGRIVETSLGYFMNPLVNVLLGVVFLRERLRRWQWFAISVAAMGVLWLTLQYGSLPWIGLTLAFTFGFYGLLKKIGKLEAMQGLSAEMSVLFVPMLLLLGYFYLGTGHTAAVSNPTTFAILMSSSLFTVAPLLFFGMAARLIPLTVLGLIQYIAPTLQFLLGVFVYHEAFNSQLLIGYVLIWIALAIFSTEGLLHRRNGIHSLRSSSTVST